MEFSRPMLIVVLIVILYCNYQALGIKLTFDSFEQTLGEEIVWLNLRVRKYNRTSSVINGTIHMRTYATNDYQFHLDVFYSRLGNQQFNHLPMKLPSAGICDFLDNLYINYGEYVHIFVNVPEKGECPMPQRDMHIFDAEFPTEVIPQIVLRTGLWKALMRGYINGKEIVSCTLVLKATDN